MIYLVVQTKSPALAALFLLQFQYSTVSGVYGLHLLCVFKIHVVKNSREKSNFVTSDFFFLLKSVLFYSILFYSTVLSTVFCSTHIACQTIFDIFGQSSIIFYSFQWQHFWLFYSLFYSILTFYPFLFKNIIQYMLSIFFSITWTYL